MTEYGSENQVFMPICLYQKSVFARREEMVRTLGHYVADATGVLLLVCDTIHAYNLMLLGKAATFESAMGKALRRGEGVFRMARRVLRQVDHRERVVIMRWDELANEERYAAVRRQVERYAESELDFGAEIELFVQASLRKVYKSVPHVDEVWERRYVLDEVAMTVFVTELLGYWREVWEVVPGEQAPDPIGFLYNRRPDLVSALTGKQNLERRLEVLSVPRRA